MDAQKCDFIVSPALSEPSPNERLLWERTQQSRLYLVRVITTLATGFRQSYTELSKSA